MMEGQPTAWTTYVSVADADAAVAKAKEAGAAMVFVEPMDVMDVGRMAVFADPTGAVIAVWQPKAHKGAGIVGEPGTLCWNELASRDTAAASAFYRSVFGWDAASTDIGDMQYFEWKLGDNTVGGMMPMAAEVPAEVPSYWLAYFAVADCDAAVAKAIRQRSRCHRAADRHPGRTFRRAERPAGRDVRRHRSRSRPSGYPPRTLGSSCRYGPVEVVRSASWAARSVPTRDPASRQRSSWSASCTSARTRCPFRSPADATAARCTSDEARSTSPTWARSSTGSTPEGSTESTVSSAPTDDRKRAQIEASPMVVAPMSSAARTARSARSTARHICRRAWRAVHCPTSFGGGAHLPRRPALASQSASPPSTTPWLRTACHFLRPYRQARNPAITRPAAKVAMKSAAPANTGSTKDAVTCSV